MGEFDLDARRAIKSQLDWSNLTPERERELLARFQTSESDAERQDALIELWESHSKLVVSIARRYRRRGDVLDLISAGHLGLHTAISRFDLSKTDVRLSAFASNWIRGAITEHIRRNATVMRLPESNTHRQLYFMRERLINDARMSCGRDGVEATDAEINERIAARIGMTVTEVENGLSLLNGGVVSLNAGAEDDNADWQETLRDDSAITEDDVIQRLDRAKVRQRVSELAHEILGERERAVFLSRYCGDSEEPVTLEILAERFGVSRERIHQLESSARRKIATALINEGYDRLTAGAPSGSASTADPATGNTPHGNGTNGNGTNSRAASTPVLSRPLATTGRTARRPKLSRFDPIVA